jgi:hypothetical protein
MRTASGPAPYSKATNRPLKKFSLPDLTPSRSSSVMGRPGHPVGRVGPSPPQIVHRRWSDGFGLCGLISGSKGKAKPSADRARPCPDIGHTFGHDVREFRQVLDFAGAP